MFQLPGFGRNLIWDGFSFSKWWRFVMKGRTMKVGCMVWYGILLLPFFLFFFLFFVHQINGVSWGCGNEREREREGEREARASREPPCILLSSVIYLFLGISIVSTTELRSRHFPPFPQRFCSPVSSSIHPSIYPPITLTPSTPYTPPPPSKYTPAQSTPHTPRPSQL